MKQYAISEDLAQRIANYLVERPYREVAGLVTELGMLQELREPDPEPKPMPEPGGE